MLYLEYWMLPQYAAFDHGGNGRRNDDPRKHGLVQVPDHFFERESHRRDRCIESGSDTGCHSHSRHPSLALFRKTGYAGQLAGNPRTNLHRRPFSPQRGSRADLNNPENKLADCIAQRDVSRAQCVCHFNLRNAAAYCSRHPIMQPEAHQQTADGWREDGPINPAVMGSNQRPVNQERFCFADADVK